MAKTVSSRRGRRPPLTRDQILGAALTLADTEGLDPLSMRRVAAALGVEAMSLYNHIANKDDLLDAMVDHVIGEIALPALGGDWRAEIRQRAVSAHGVLLRHPWAALLILSRINTGPNMLRYVNATVGCLREAGFSYAQADHAWNAIDSHVYGFTVQVLKFPFKPEEYAPAARAYLPMIPPELPYFRDLTVEVAEGRHNGLHAFTFGLDLILDGLERILAAMPAEKGRDGGAAPPA